MNTSSAGRHSALLLIAATLSMGQHRLATAQSQYTPQIIPCGSLKNAHGPFDYRTHKGRPEVQVVEDYHFTPLVENLIRPMYQHFAADFDYTLRAVPNHHRALISMVRYSERVKNNQPPGAGYTVDCYFDRALRLAPDDTVVRMIYAGWLGRANRVEEAARQLDYVSTLAGDNAFTHYNAGLHYIEIKAYDKALARAHDAMRLGMSRTELRDKLQQLGHWKEPAAEAAAPQAASAAVVRP